MSIKGYVDLVSPTEVAGWAFDSSHPGVPVTVRIIADGAVIATGPAARFRGDLLAAGIGTGAHGFIIPADTVGKRISCMVGDAILPSSSDVAASGGDAVKAGEYWNTMQHWAPRMPPRSRWPESPQIVREHNYRVCGRPLEGNHNRGLIELLREKAGDRFPFARAVSVGCATGGKELKLIEDGIVDHFDLFDVSADLLRQGSDVAAQKGLSDKASFIHGYDFANELGRDYDLVYWDSSLHHMFDADAAVRWSYDVLRPGGWFVMTDFVGATRWQWKPEVYDLADMIRTALPDHCFVHPFNPDREARFDFRIRRFTLEEMNFDPSEAADSEAIVPAIEKYFPDPMIKHVGGTVYHLVLNDVLTHIPEDSDLLTYLLMLDRNIDIPHFAVALAQRPEL